MHNTYTTRVLTEAWESEKSIKFSDYYSRSVKGMGKENLEKKHGKV